MFSDVRINDLKIIIATVEKEFQHACDLGKPFYAKKEILQRLRLAMNELEELETARNSNPRSR